MGRAILKVGDTVKIKTLEEGCTPLGIYVAEQMVSYSETVTTVTKVTDPLPTYRLECDRGQWMWDITMFELQKRHRKYKVHF